MKQTLALTLLGAAMFMGSGCSSKESGSKPVSDIQAVQAQAEPEWSKQRYTMAITPDKPSQFPPAVYSVPIDRQTPVREKLDECFEVETYQDRVIISDWCSYKSSSSVERIVDKAPFGRLSYGDSWKLEYKNNSGSGEGYFGAKKVYASQESVRKFNRLYNAALQHGYKFPKNDESVVPEGTIVVGD